jgi:hypothetical protein
MEFLTGTGFGPPSFPGSSTAAVRSRVMSAATIRRQRVEDDAHLTALAREVGRRCTLELCKLHSLVCSQRRRADPRGRA